MARRPVILLVLLTALFILSNCVKPLHGDDGVYQRYAAQIAQHPLDPYGFSFNGEPANHTLAPPVSLYWWGAGLRVWGDRPFLWKLWMWPFGALLVFSLFQLFSRFAAPLQMPLTWMTVLSPLILPAWNLMLDVPVLAVALFSLAIFLRAYDRQSLVLAAAAGLVAGLAMQTKYTAFLLPVLFLLYGFRFGQPRLACTAAALPVLFFVAVEALLAWRYGESHFLYALGQRHGGFAARLGRLLLPLVAMAGGAAPGVALLGLAALGRGRRAVCAAGAGVALGYALLAAVPEHYAVFLREAQTGKPLFTLNNVIFGSLGAWVLGTVCAVAWRLQSSTPTEGDTDSRSTGFLLGWLALELALYFLISPLPGARRIMGMALAATLVAGRLASRTCTAGPPWAVRAAAVCSGAAGLLVYGIDLRDAWAGKQTIEAAACWIRQHDDATDVWYYGWDGLQFYGERAGMKSVPWLGWAVRPGDWYLVDSRVFRNPDPIAARAQLVAELSAGDPIHLHTTLCYYAGSMPLQHHDGPRYTVKIYRVLRPLSPAMGPAPAANPEPQPDALVSR
jgi:hypothetical protein